MKKIWLLAFVGLIICASKPINSPFDLKTAIDKKLITCSILGNAESTHYYQPIQITVSNLTQKELTINIPNGLQIISDSIAIQDVIITQEELISVAPKQKVSQPLFAMCIQQSHSANNKNQSYTIGDLANNSLLKISKEIEKNKSYNSLGQYAIWSVTNQYPLEKIDGFEEEEAKHYQQLVAGILGVAPPKTQPNLYKTYYQRTKSNKRSVVGNFSYKIHKPSPITIGLFNENNIIVRELYNNPKQQAGEHKFNFAFDLKTYQDPRYYIRLIINGKIMVDLTMEPQQT